MVPLLTNLTFGGVMGWAQCGWDEDFGFWVLRRSFWFLGVLCV